MRRMRQYDGWITASDLIKYMFCQRYPFFVYCLEIPQREEKRYKVLKGREIHKIREKINRNYLRKKQKVKKKLIEQYLFSEKLKIRGKVDEVLFMEDNTASPFDYKYAEYKGRIFRTYKYQCAFYGILIEESYNVNVEKGFICYTRSNNKIIEIKMKETLKQEIVNICQKLHEIIGKGRFPEGKIQKNKCVDCTYRNICPR